MCTSTPIGERESAPERPPSGHRHVNVALQQAEIAETGVAPTSDDQMFVHRDAEGLRGIDDVARHRDVRLRGRRVARGVVVHEDQG